MEDRLHVDLARAALDMRRPVDAVVAPARSGDGLARPAEAKRVPLVAEVVADEVAEILRTAGIRLEVFIPKRLRILGLHREGPQLGAGRDLKGIQRTEEDKRAE